MAYLFRREDTGEVVEVDFATNLSQDAGGYVTLPDGVKARRVNGNLTRMSNPLPRTAGETLLPSDTLGFQARQLPEFQEHLEKSGCTGIEFKPDPMCPQFYQVHFGSHAERDRYIKARGMVDRNKTAGAALTPEALEAAIEMAKNIGQ